ncbi:MULTISPECIES: hypothetical protein [Myroides]|uniref:Uncharacterized protein n=1 Tax=Myroides albus TaxID=2562892 RepID=A0A6I3LJF5_9FLAO|nr:MULTISPECIES: hypothetical protein [Myroides]MTG98708.1 hypothetical protein [Myroides albus]MVX35658.1 hypothetical protein [Myroides sp. LoEW2-1]UVD78795.1 hypothetical protein NWE55_11775 [Myroides albus]
MLTADFSIVLFISCALFTLFFVFKNFLSTAGLVFLLSISTVLIDNHEIRLALLIFLNTLSLYMCRIKAMKIELKYETILNFPVILIIFSLTTLFTAIDNDFTFSLMDILTVILLGATFSFFLVLIIICIFQVGYTVYICNKFPMQSITSLEISNLERSGGGSSPPFFYANFKINKKVKIDCITIDGINYSKAKLGHKLNMTKYKTDGKENFVLF